jgi:hypothetical protein
MKVSWALVMAAIVAILNWLVGFQFSGLTADAAAAIIAVITAVAALVVALKTRPVSPTAFTGLITAGVTLLAAYGLHFSQQGVATFSTAVLAVLSLVLHGQISPTKDAPSTGVLGVQPSRSAGRG